MHDPTAGGDMPRNIGHRRGSQAGRRRNRGLPAKRPFAAGYDVGLGLPVVSISDEPLMVTREGPLEIMYTPYALSMVALPLLVTDEPAACINADVSAAAGRHHRRHGMGAGIHGPVPEHRREQLRLRLGNAGRHPVVHRGVGKGSGGVRRDRHALFAAGGKTVLLGVKAGRLHAWSWRGC